MSADEYQISMAGGDGESAYQFALFRRSDSAASRPFDDAILRTRKQAEEYLKLNYLQSVWPSLEVRARPTPACWTRLAS